MPEPIPFKPRTVTPAGQIEAACGRFLNAKSAHGAAANTITAYRHDLEQFAGFMLGRGIEVLTQVRPADVDAWTEALAQGESNSLRTVARKLSVAKSLFTWAVGQQLVTQNTAALATPVKFRSAKVVAPGSEAIVRMLEGIDTSTPVGIRDRAMFQLMADSALRISAVRGLDLYEADDEPQCYIRPDGLIRYRAKGGKAKTSAATNPVTLRWIARWLEVRDSLARRIPSQALFISERGERMGRAAIHARIKLHGAAAGLPAISSHKLRHRRIGEVMRSGDLALAQLLSGHEHKSTTLDIYGEEAAEVTLARLRQVAPWQGAGHADHA